MFKGSLTLGVTACRLRPDGTVPIASSSRHRLHAEPIRGQYASLSVSVHGLCSSASRPIVAWELVWDRAIQHGWECYDPDTTLLEAQLQEAVKQ